MHIVGIERGKIMPINAKDKKTIFDRAYPIGSYYFSNENTSPASFIGGQWEIVSGRFLKATSSSGGTGGSETQTISGFLPSHSHSTSSHSHTFPSHTHSYTGSHSHTSSSNHSHSGTGLAHTHTSESGYMNPGGGYGGTQIDVNWQSTASPLTYHLGNPGNNQVKKTATITSSTSLTGVSSSGNTSVSSSSLSAPSSSSWSTGSQTITSSSTGTTGSSSIDIMPPYTRCYCWRRIS